MIINIILRSIPSTESTTITEPTAPGANYDASHATASGPTLTPNANQNTSVKPSGNDESRAVVVRIEGSDEEISERTEAFRQYNGGAALVKYVFQMASNKFTVLCESDATRKEFIAKLKVDFPRILDITSPESYAPMIKIPNLPPKFYCID